MWVTTSNVKFHQIHSFVSWLQTTHQRRSPILLQKTARFPKKDVLDQKILLYCESFARNICRDKRQLHTEKHESSDKVSKLTHFN